MRIFFSILLCTIAIFVNAQKNNNKSQIALQEIDNLDSIIVDFANGTLNGNILSVPLYIKTDDDINALDFSFKINETKVKVDTILKNGNFEMTYFFNPNDRKLRLTSYSLADYNTNKKILTIYFKLLQTTLDNKDVYEIAGFLNGDGCPIKITAKSFSTTNAIDENLRNEIGIYPNPTSDYITISNAQKTTLKIINMKGEIVHSESISASYHKIDLSKLGTGMYICKCETIDGRKFTKSIVKN